MSTSEVNKFNNLGEEIVKQRKLKGLNQKKLASMCGLSPNWLGKIEGNRVVPTDKILRLIARGLTLPETYFLENQPDTDNRPTHELTVYLHIPPELKVTPERLDMINKAMVDAGNHIINTIKKLDKSD